MSSNGGGGIGVALGLLVFGAFHFAGPIIRAARSPSFRPSTLIRDTLPSYPVIFLLGLHTAGLLQCLIYPPFDVFDYFGLSIAQPGWQLLQDAVHSDACIQASPAYPSTALSYTQLLATKLLESRDQRRLYAELGHGVFTCSWCRTKEEYLLAKMPQIVFWYLGEVGLLSVIGRLEGRNLRYTSRWSSVIAGMGGAEVMYRWLGTPLFGNASHVKDSSIYFYRTLFLSLTPAIFLLIRPSTSSPPPSTSQLLASAVATRSGLLSSELTSGASIEIHQALSRHELLRDLLVREGVDAMEESRVVRADETFNNETAELAWRQVEPGQAGARGMRMNAEVKVAFLWKRMSEMSKVLAEGGRSTGAS